MPISTLPSFELRGQESFFTIDWSDLREIVSDWVKKGSHPAIKNSTNRYQMNSISSPGSWQGYTKSELESWLDHGFKTDNLGIEITPPVREKRRYFYSEDADEMHIDRALSGEDNYAGEFTKRVIIPGVSILVNIAFSSSVKAEIVNAYNVFMCQCIQSLETSGVDCEVTLAFPSDRAITGQGRQTSIVRVKKENENSDFGSFSPMISPAAFRTFGFAAMICHAESRKSSIDSSFGFGRHHRTEEHHTWNVFQDEKTGQIVLDCPYMPTDFPKAEMQMKFRQVLGLIEN
jgi:hypothetical protein